MRLRWKFSLILALCVLMSVGTTAFVLTHFFAIDQEAYLQDFQSTLALYSERALNSRLDVLYSETESVLSELLNGKMRILSSIPGTVSAEFWNSGKLVGTEGLHSEKNAAPQSDRDRWNLLASPFPGAIRWRASFGAAVLILDLKTDWFAGILESTHGANSTLVFGDGSVLLSSDPESPGIFANFPAEVMSQIVAKPPRTVQTLFFSPTSKESGRSESFLGTFLTVSTSPPLFLVITTPRSVIRSVIQRTIKQSVWVACIFLLVSIGTGILFSATLTSPLQALVRQTTELAKGRFESRVLISEKRRDEVGLLSHAFNRMGAELQKIRDELRRSERLATLGIFSAAIAHEIKNPLSAILGNAQIVRRKLNAQTIQDTGAVLEALQFVEEETLRANKIIAQLMKFSRKEEVPRERVDLAERVRKTLQILDPILQTNNVEVRKEVADAPLFCLAHADQIHEVLLNLIQNALHAMKDQDSKILEIFAGIRQNEIVIEITDNGYGLSEEVKKHLFEPFFTTKGIGEGTGLGLAVCHGIIVNHQGTIEVDSVPGKGTTFRLRLPLAQMSTTVTA